MINKVSFTGIKPPYTNKKGYHITPISKDPTPFEIQRAIHATKTQEAHSGLNGKAYFYGQDLVVKKYLNKDEALNFNPSREIAILDTMFDKGVIPKNVQQGKFAFTTPQNETYLVSTRIRGEELNPKTNKFNKQNLRALVETIETLDRPVLSRRTDAQRKHQTVFPYEVPMHYDLSTGNFNVEKDSAGIFDLEYLQFVDLNSLYYEMNHTDKFKGTLCELSDIPGILCNLRNFEYRSLLDYIGRIAPEERMETFKTYLNIKSDYHNKRGQFYRKEVWNFAQNEDRESQQIARSLRDLERKEYIHAYCLKNPTEEIVKAEAIKIQIAKYIYNQSPFSQSLEEKINPEQIVRYVLQAVKYFENCLENAKNQGEEVYFKDCLDVVKSQTSVIRWMDWQAKKHTIEEMLHPDDRFEDLSKETQNLILERLKGLEKGRKLFMAKSTDEHIPTLDEHLNLALLT
ncbi:MAG: hypothetical protein IJW73_00320 [Candidatus Gastranaerophilales bacterium]|nr:hypothetical protein [Candidatus Gastranaerophilales bacterium]